MATKFISLKNTLLFCQVLTLFLFTVYLSHFFEVSLDGVRPDEDTINGFYGDEQKLWTFKIKGLIIFIFVASLYFILIFGIYCVIEEIEFGSALYLFAYITWILAFHSVLLVYGLTIPKRVLIFTEILTTCLSLAFLLSIKRDDILEFVRVSNMNKSETDLSVITIDNPPYNPYYQRYSSF